MYMKYIKIKITVSVTALFITLSCSACGNVNENEASRVAEEYKREYEEGYAAGASDQDEGKYEDAYREGYKQAISDVYDGYFNDFGYYVGYHDAKEQQPLEPWTFDDELGDAESEWHYFGDGYEDGYSDGSPDEYAKSDIEYAMIPVESSFIESIGYSDVHHILRVKFLTGGIYDYYEVAEDLFQGFRQAESKGSYFHEYVRDKYIYEKVSDE